MVRQTFLNLEAEKRERIFHAALEEFARYPLQSASTNRIVARAGIPKGSIYQYFQDKNDLYRYVVTEAARAKLAYLSEHTQVNTPADFFERLGRLMLLGAEFDLSHPYHSQVLANAINHNQAEVSELNLEKMSADFLHGELARAQQDGQVRADLPVDLLVFVLNTLTINFSKLAAQRAFIQSREQFLNAKNLEKITALDLEGMVADFVRLIKDGFARH